MPKPNNKLAGGVVRGVSLTLFFCLFLSLASFASAAPPAAPTNLTASTRYSIEMRYTSEIILRWQDNSDNETGFSIGRGSSLLGPFIQLATRGANSTTYSDFNLTPNTTYYYRVYAYNSSGFSMYSNVVSIKTSNVANLPPSIVSINPSSGTVNPDQYATLTTIVSDPDGWQDLQLVLLTINSSLTFNKCLFGYYNPKHNLLYLANDAGNKWLGGFTPGSSNIIENSYARIDCSKTTVTGTGNNLTINWAVSFKPVFTGEKNTYLYVSDNTNLSAGWEKKGVVTIMAQPHDTIPLAAGQAVTGIISVERKKLYYIFNANANDTVTIRAITNSGRLQCYLELYGPDGTKLVENRDQINKILPVSGKYTILVRDFYDSYFNPYTGTFWLIYGILNNNNWAPSIRAGEVVNGTVDNNNRIKFYRFSANVNDTITIQVDSTYKVLSRYTYLELYGPDGTRVAAESQDRIEKVLSASGNYTILVRARNNEYGFDYKLTYIRNNAAPITEALVPAAGSSQPDSQVFFTATYADPDGFSDIEEVYLLINGSTDGANCLYAYYNHYIDQLYLRDDANTLWVGGFSPGTPMTIENSFAVLNCGETEVNKLGNLVTVRWSVSFKGAFSGHDYNIYLLVKDRMGVIKGWSQMGSWRVDPLTGSVNITSFAPGDKSRFVEGTPINCSALAEPSGDTYEYQFLVDGVVKKQFSPDNKWNWLSVSQDRGIHTLTIKVRNQYGTTAEDAHRLIIYRRPVEPQ